MKRIILLILVFIPILSYSQGMFNISNNVNIEFSMGVVNINPSTTFNSGSFQSINTNNINLMIDVSILGFYFSFNYSSRFGRDYEELRSRIFHFGYKIPIFKFLYIYPIFGRIKIANGYYLHPRNFHWDNWSRDKDYVITDMIVNDYDYGGGIDVKLGKYFIISAKLTKYTYGASVGVVFGF